VCPFHLHPTTASLRDKDLMEISAVLSPASWRFVIATWLRYHLQRSTTQLLEYLHLLGPPPDFIIYCPTFFYQAQFFCCSCTLFSLHRRLPNKQLIPNYFLPIGLNSTTSLPNFRDSSGAV